MLLNDSSEIGEHRSSDGEAARADASALLDVVRGLVAELASGRASPVSLDSALETDLGIDSLSRMELALRIEHALGVRVGDRGLLEAESVRDLLRVLRAAPRDQRTQARISSSAPTVAIGEALALPSDARTLVEVLRWHAQRSPARIHVRLLGQGDMITELSHESLHRRSGAIAGALRDVGVARGDAVALMLPTGAPLLECFMGTLIAGATPVPVYPPAHARQIEEHLQRQAGILDSARAVLLLCEASALPAARILRLGVRSLRSAVTPEQLQARSTALESRVQVDEHDVALVQYTSGSTGEPKGVVLTHANLLADIRAMGEAIGATPADVFVSWLPLYHDMGLIGAWLGCLYHGIPLVLMPPQDFLARPSRWLRAIGDHRGTLTAAPNFAYDIVSTRVPDSELEGLDLSSLRGAMNGSEPVRATTLDAFCARFERRGFQRSAMWPVYGLAECGVGLTFPPPGRGPRIDRIDAQALRERGAAMRSVEASAASIVCCGSALPSHELRVVDEPGSELPDRREGRIQFRGPAATSGYLRNPEATRRLFDGDWLETGDLGYVADGELFVTGRIKDMIKHAGHNLHPDDLESAVGALPGVRRGCVAAFGSGEAGARGERIVLVVETRLEDPAALERLHASVASRALPAFGAAADDIVIVPPHTIPKTSSGKIRRAECRRRYERHELLPGDRRVTWQLIRSWAAAAGRRVRPAVDTSMDLASAAWMWLDFVAAAALGVSAALLPRLDSRRRMARAIARRGLAVSGIRVECSGQDVLGDAGGGVYVCNHASYVDWLVLIANLPARAHFVAKRDLAGRGPLGWLLARMGVHFVERVDWRARFEDAAALSRLMTGGESLVMFPEGTFGRAPGLHPFHMGAFVAAARAGVRVVPVALAGTRSALRDGSWRPRRGRVTLHVDSPLQPTGSAWSDAVRLRDNARACIARHCGEPLVRR